MSFFSSVSSETNLATAKIVISTAASVAATAMVVRSVTNEFLPQELRDYVVNGIHSVFSRFSSELTMVIEEFEGLENNQIYEAAETYLGSKISPSTHRFRVSKSDTEKTFTLTMERNQSVTDRFNGVKLNWLLVCRQVEHSRNFHNPRDLNSTLKSEVRSLELTFHKKHKDMVLNTYLPFILEEAKSKKQEMKALRILTVDYQNMYGNLSDAWVGTTLDHPATFDTLALDRDVREFVEEDLRRFVKRKEYYRKVGKAWKRGYLLYGPPGTGKSSLIAAIANYLHFDVYDLELTELNCNSELRRLLIAMPNRSILVVEDIDCTIEFQDRMAETRAAAGNNSRQMDPDAVKSTLSNLAFGNVMAAAARDYQKELLAQGKGAQASSSVNEEVDLDELMDDPELEKLHADRIAALKKEAEKREAWKQKGHGEFREVTEGDFLGEVTGSEKVICHFYHREFYRCKIMDKHLKSLSTKHIDTKFIKVDAENAPFFVTKLAIKTLPCVILFRQGVAVDRLVGFQDLGAKDDFSTRALEVLLLKKGIIEEKKNEDDEDGGGDESLRRSVRTSVLADSDSD